MIFMQANIRNEKEMTPETEYAKKLHLLGYLPALFLVHATMIHLLYKMMVQIRLLVVASGA